MLTLLHVAGGVALILYGIRVLRKGLDKLFGARLASLMQRLGRNRWRAGATGLVVSLMSPSSTSITLLGVQFVRSHLLRFEQMLAVLLGASIGLTIELQLISFDLYEQAPLLILVGVLGFQFGTRKIVRASGQVVLGLGFIFMAVGIIKSAGTGVAGNADVSNLMQILAKYPWLLLALGAALTVMLQSSTAALALMLALASAGVIGMDLAIPYVIGADVGLGLTTLIVGYSDPDSRRLGLGYFGMRLTLAILLMLLLPWFAPLVEASGANEARQIANAHSMFNLLLALLWIAPLPLVVRLISQAVPAEHRPTEERVPRYLNDSYLDSPALAFGQSMREIMRVAGIVEEMLRDVWIALRDRDVEICDRIHERDDVVDELDKQIKRFLTRAGHEAYSEEESATQIYHLRFINVLETVGDIIDKNLIELVRKRIRKGRFFSGPGFEELGRAHTMVLENFHIASTAFATRDQDLAKTLLAHDQHLERLDFELRKRHFERLAEGIRETVESSSIHLDMLTYLTSINSHLTAVARLILEEQAPAASDRDDSEDGDADDAQPQD